MFNTKTIIAILALVIFFTGPGHCQNLANDWGDFLHYTKIGRLDMATGYAQAVVDSNPDPLELLALSIRRSDPKIVAEEIRRLSSTDRGRLAGVKRLQNAGEYAIPYMVDALADAGRKDEFPNIVWALPQIGRDAIRPLAAALQGDDMAVRAEIIKALGKIGYPQSLGYLKYVVENDQSAELRNLAAQSIREIDPAAAVLPAAQLFYQLAEQYYYHTDSLAPADDADVLNIWFWNSDGRRLVMEKVDKSYFNELMAMRACEWALKADETFGQAIGLWLAAFLKAESTGLDMPEYFGNGHAAAIVYATTAGPEYLHQALARALKDKNAYVALGAVEALAATAGEKSLLYSYGPSQPLIDALSFEDTAVRFSAAIAMGAAGPVQRFPQSRLIVENLAQALAQTEQQAQSNTKLLNYQPPASYPIRSARVMLKLARTRNRVVDLSKARDAVIEATKNELAEMQVLAAAILAHMQNPQAQRAIAAMALNEKNDVNIRIQAFGALAISAKVNANMLEEEQIDVLYSLVSSLEADPKLRSAAAAAYGALNLPSRKVKDLVLDQSRS